MEQSQGHDAENGQNGTTTTNGTSAPATRKPSTRVKEPVDYDDLKHLRDVEDDTEHGVARSTDHKMGEWEGRINDLDGDSWETDSLLADALAELPEDGDVQDDPGACTLEEAVNFRQQLRILGPEEFCRRTVDAGLITAKKLLTAFGVRPPAFLEGLDDENYHGLLSLALSRELSKRAKLLKYNTIDDAVNLLKTSSNIIVLTGAGISTSLGIPDFRSKGTGLYSKLQGLGLNDPQEVFDISVFKEDPTIFYSVAKDILPSTDRFTPTHAFIAKLDSMGKLLTNYSQNIDNLEAKAGISPDKLVQCHGSFATASCVKCGHKVIGDTLFDEIKAGKIPHCTKCAEKSTKGKGNARKRKVNKDGTERKVRRRPGDFDSNSDSEYDQTSASVGIMKPDITFFGEALPDLFHKRLTEHDRYKVDLVIVIGTSLKVAPVSEVVPYLPPHIPQIYISRTPVTHVNFDIDLLGDCDIVVSELCRRAGWDLDHEMIPTGQVVDVTLVDGYESRHVFCQSFPRADRPEDPPEDRPGSSGGDTESTSASARSTRSGKSNTSRKSRARSVKSSGTSGKSDKVIKKGEKTKNSKSKERVETAIAEKAEKNGKAEK